nr:MAG TPA: hypothetical protein [Caudoviricetes sp.]
MFRQLCRRESVAVRGTLFFLRKRNKKPGRRTMGSRLVTPSSSEDAKGVSSTHTLAHWQVSETRTQRV